MSESGHPMGRDKVRITVDLPLSLRERMHKVLERGMAKSQNALIVQAVEQFLEELERTWIDSQFAEMAHDPAYQALQLTLAEEFASVDWETWQVAAADDEKR